MSFEDDKLNNATIRLNKLDHTPAANDLEMALQQAKATTAAVIELPWKTTSSPATYVLKVSSGDSGDETNWVLHKGETVDAAVLWSFDSDDISLIESLIAAECDSARELGLPTDQPINTDETKKSQEQKATPSKIQPLESIASLPEAVNLDIAAIQKVGDQFKDKQTGMIEENYFLHFLLREYERYCHTKDPFALVIFRIRVDYGGGKVGFLPERAYQEAIVRCTKVLRTIDYLGHYQENKYAILLPGSNANGGVQCVKALEKELLSEPLQPGLDPQQLRFSAGIASVPDTCEQVDILIAAALDALKQSAQGTSSLVVFPSVSRAR